MKSFLLASTVVFILLTGMAGAAPPFSQSRIDEIAALLPAQPGGPGHPIGDRTAWDQLARNPVCQEVMINAAKARQAQPIPITDDLYLDFSRTGNRDRYQNPSYGNMSNLTALVLAECLENKGAYLPAIESFAQAICAMRCWTLPAHDRGLAAFNGKTHIVDLGCSYFGWTLACVDFLLGDKLTPATRSLIREHVMRRVLDPMRQEIDGQFPQQWWFTTTNNWNAVCLANVAGTALTLLPEARDRAFYVAAAEHYIGNFLKGFGADGYCSEGVGYWNYGYGHFILLSETLLQATRGTIDLLRDDRARRAALYGRDIFITPKLCPAFADCTIDSTPDNQWLVYLQKRLGLPMGLAAGDIPLSSRSQMANFLLFAFEQYPYPAGRQANTASDHPGERTWFDQSGILIGRPGAATGCVLSMALKGGHNDEHHNHNDVGSYLVALDDTLMLADPGAEVYTARTFSSKRYDSKALNSWGHPVPLVAGQMQKTGAAARGVLLAWEPSESHDTILWDMTSAYEVKTLETLTRRFIYDRTGRGSFTVQDQVRFSQPESFETALVTLGRIEQSDASHLTITAAGKSVTVAIDCEQPFTLVMEPIDEAFRYREKPTRIAIRLNQPVSQARVTVRIAPH